MQIVKCWHLLVNVPFHKHLSIKFFLVFSSFLTLFFLTGVSDPCMQCFPLQPSWLAGVTTSENPATATVSLRSDVMMEFWKRRTTAEICDRRKKDNEDEGEGFNEDKVVEVMLGANSLIVFCHEYYTNMLHSIPEIDPWSQAISKEGGPPTQRAINPMCFNIGDKAGDFVDVLRGHRISITIRHKFMKE